MSTSIILAVSIQRCLRRCGAHWYVQQAVFLSLASWAQDINDDRDLVPLRVHSKQGEQSATVM